MPKDPGYHRAAVQYNEKFAEFAEKVAGEIENEIVSNWCHGIHKQHLFHAKRHQRALDRLEGKQNEGNSEMDETDVDTIGPPAQDVAAEQAAFARSMENDEEKSG